MADRNPKVLFNDGEGVDHTDFNRLQELLERKVFEQALRVPGRVGNALNMGFADSTGADIFGDARPGVGPTGTIFVGDSLTGFRDDTPVAAGALWFEAFVYAQIQGAGTPGTQPTDSSDLLVYVGDDEEREYSADLTAATPPIAGDFRWDTLTVRLGYEDTNSVSRDFKDAVTGAPSTTSTNKDRRFSIEWSHVQGPQQGTYTTAAIASGFAPVITKRRPVGGDSQPYDPDDFYYHPFPTRLGVEDISGQDLLPDGGFGTAWDVDTGGFGSMQKVGTGAGTLYALPRHMHAGCRLMGVAVIANADPDADVDIGRFTYSNLAMTDPVFTSLVGVGDGVAISTSGDGFQGAGAEDWDSVHGEDARKLPIWGNGTTHGPLFAPERGTQSGGRNFRRLAVRIASGGAFGSGNWAGGDRIYMVRLFYLY